MFEGRLKHLTDGAADEKAAADDDFLKIVILLVAFVRCVCVPACVCYLCDASCILNQLVFTHCVRKMSNYTHTHKHTQSTDKTDRKTEFMGHYQCGIVGKSRGKENKQSKHCQFPQ